MGTPPEFAPGATTLFAFGAGLFTRAYIVLSPGPS